MSNECARTQLTQPKDDDSSKSKKQPSEPPASGLGDDSNGTNDNVDGRETNEVPELGHNGEGVGKDDSDAEGEDDVKLGGGTRERRDEREVDQQPNSPSMSSYSTSDATQVTTGLATPPPGPLERPPLTHLATLTTTHLAKPLSTHLATLLSAYLATQSMDPVQHKPSLPTTHLATPPSIHHATLPSAHLATRAQDDTIPNDLGAPTTQGIQTPFMDLLGNDLASFGTDMGFDTWGDQFAIPQVPLPGVGPTVVDLAGNLGSMPPPCNLFQGQTGWNTTVGMQFPTTAAFQPMNLDVGATAFDNFDFGAVGSVVGGFSPPFIPGNFDFGGVPDGAQYSTRLSSASSPAILSSPRSSLAAQSPKLPSEVAVLPAPPLPPTGPTTDTSNEGVCLKRKHVPSLRAQRDNAIGNENQNPTPATHDETSKLKRGRLSDTKVMSTTKNK